jgi:hypothetical protein
MGSRAFRFGRNDEHGPVAPVHEALTHGRGWSAGESALNAAPDGDEDRVVVSSGPGHLGDRIAMADLELPRDISAGQSHFAGQVTVIRDLVVGHGESPGATERGGAPEGTSADDVDRDDAAGGHGGEPGSDLECRQGPLGSAESHHNG